MNANYLSEGGSSLASATSIAPSGSFVPFATTARVKQAMSLNPAADTAYLRGGTYSAPTPLTLTSADRGSAFLVVSGDARR